MKTIMNRLITRPRISGSVASCTLELAVTLIVRPTMPIGASSAAKSQNDGASAAVDLQGAEEQRRADQQPQPGAGAAGREQRADQRAGRHQAVEQGVGAGALVEDVVRRTRSARSGS